MRRVALIVALLLAPGITAAQTPGPAPVPAGTTKPAPQAVARGNADNGKKLFVSVGCYQCHGYEGQGSTATGPRVGPRPLPLAAFTRFVRAPNGQMPPYTSKVLTDAQLADIHAFLETRPTPVPAAKIPLLQ